MLEVRLLRSVEDLAGLAAMPDREMVTCFLPAPALLPLTESLPLLRLVNSCLYRSRDTACGCSGFRCALRTVNPVVNHLECLECVKRYDNS